MAGEIALLVGREGLVRPLVVGKGPEAARRAAQFLAEIAPELSEFHERVAARFAKDEGAAPTVLRTKRPAVSIT